MRALGLLPTNQRKKAHLFTNNWYAFILLICNKLYFSPLTTKKFIQIYHPNFKLFVEIYVIHFCELNLTLV